MTATGDGPRPKIQVPWVQGPGFVVFFLLGFGVLGFGFGLRVYVFGLRDSTVVVGGPFSGLDFIGSAGRWDLCCTSFRLEGFSKFFGAYRGLYRGDSMGSFGLLFLEGLFVRALAVSTTDLRGFTAVLHGVLLV